MSIKCAQCFSFDTEVADDPGPGGGTIVACNTCGARTTRAVEDQEALATFRVSFYKMHRGQRPYFVVDVKAANQYRARVRAADENPAEYKRARITSARKIKPASRKSRAPGTRATR